MEKKYRFFVTAIDARGHINAALSLAELVQSRGHSIIFAHHEMYRQLAESRGFQFVPFKKKFFPTREKENEDFFTDWIKKTSHLFHGSWMDNLRKFTDLDYDKMSTMFIMTKEVNDAIEDALKEVKQIDAIISDLVDPLPCVINSGLISFPICSCNPLIIYPNDPPGFSGFSTKQKNHQLWNEFKQLNEKLFSKFAKLFIDWLQSNNIHEYTDSWGATNFYERPKYVGFYNYPKDLDYAELGEPYPNWIRIDGLTRKADDEEFEIPQCLQNKSGKLIYFSMGSIASNDIKTMNFLLNILAKSRHRFIVSTGSLENELKLAQNMWGKGYVNQIKVLQVVDLVITHGGNNSLIETLAAGKPLIVIPYFFDQLDNAQRIEDLGLGKRINLYEITEESFLQAIEYALNDLSVHQKVKQIAQNIANSDSHLKAIEMIEKIIKENHHS